MADPDPKPSPVAWIFSSRKGLLTLLALFVCGLFALVLAWQCVKGTISFKEALLYVTADLFGGLAMLFKLIDGITKEDVATKTTPNIAAGGNVTVNDKPADPGSSPS